MKGEIEFQHRHVFIALLRKGHFVSGQENINARELEVELFILPG